MGEQCAKRDRKMERNVREMYTKIIKERMDHPVLAASKGGGASDVRLLSGQSC